MTPLPGMGDPVHFWRLDNKVYATSWDSGEGARQKGGRWNPAGMPVVYASLDPACAILEVAVHTTFEVLNSVPHVLTSGVLLVPWSTVHVVQPTDVPNPLWLFPAAQSASQQAFGATLLLRHDFVALPSSVSRNSWNLIFDPTRAAGKYELKTQEDLALDPRLDPPARPKKP